MNEVIIDSEQKIRVEVFAEVLVNNGFRDIRACSGNFLRPENLFLKQEELTFMPDITAWKTRFCIFKVETAKSVKNHNNHDIWKEVSDFSSRHDYSFGIVVPQYSMMEANRIVDELGIHARLLEM